MNDISKAYESPKSVTPRRISKWAVFGGLLIVLVLLVPLIMTARKVAENRSRTSYNLKQLQKAMEAYSQSYQQKTSE